MMVMDPVQKAIKTDGNEQASLHTNAPVPKVLPGYVLVKTTYVALNPTEYLKPSQPRNPPPKQTRTNPTAGNTSTCAPTPTTPSAATMRASSPR